MQVLQGHCPLCSGNVTGNDALKYYCKRCNIFFDKKHLLKESKNICTRGTGLFIGRFQPFHNGHLWAIKEILKECDHITVAIGSSEKKNTKIDPFSYEERKAMIEATLKDYNITHYTIVPVPDINNDTLWPGHVKKLVGLFDFVYTGSELTKKLFLMEGAAVIELPRHEGISATEIRLRISKGLKYDDLIPKGTIQVLQQMNGVERLREKPQEQSKTWIQKR